MNGMRERMLQTFLAEAGDLVRDLDAGLRLMKAGDHSEELVSRLFRAAHSIKGSGGMFGLAPLVGFTHVVESLLDRVRSGRLQPDAALVSALQESCDHIADLVDVLVARREQPDEQMMVRDSALRRVLAQHDEPAYAYPSTIARQPAADAQHDGVMRGDDCWHVSVRFGVDIFRYGINPLSFVRDLESLGEVVALTTVDALPAADGFNPEDCHLGFEIDLRGDLDKARIADVFDFVADCSQLRILPPQSHVSDFLELIRDLPESDARLGDILVDAGTLTRAELEAGLAEQRERGMREGLQPALGTLLVEHNVVAPVVVQAALERQAESRSPAPSRTAPACADSTFLRVRADQLDELINRVGELVIAGAGAAMLAERSGDTALRESQSLVSRLMEDIRERALRLRMVPIGETFSRFHRVVRDIGRELGKEIELCIEGEDTELDKSVVEKLADPLVHLVRNAADHGLESRDARLAAGKPGTGTIRLTAAHESGQVVIEIADDGAGMDRSRILTKARERGLVADGTTLSDHDILQLVFEPGFSTAETVTNLSGRGVGMDVVRRNIAALRGDIQLHSTQGEGTTVRIRLPLTLAIIEGFLVGVGDAAYVMPLDRVIECVEMPAGFAPHRGYLDLRGHALPLLRLREQLGISGASRTRRENVVVVDCGGRRAGIVVDALLGEFQTVIKPLGPLFAGLRGISGSTILGGGDVALILDLPELVDAAVAGEIDSLAGRQHGTPVAPTAPLLS
ncbi:chemotaxis protein CheA [Lysobacter sp. HA18]